MMVIDSEERYYQRIVSTDPGTNTLGVAVLQIRDGKLYVEHAATFLIGKLATAYPIIIEYHGEKIAKLHAITECITTLLRAWQPTWIASEGPYLGRFPRAFAALVECVDAIRRAVISYDSFTGLSVTDPATVKKSVGVNGKSGDKELMRAAIAAHPLLVFTDAVNIDALDEHSIDAIAVGVCFYITHLHRTTI